MWNASNSVSNASCPWRQEALNSSIETFKTTISKWRILRSVFNCTRIWRGVGRQAQNLQVGYTLDLQFRSMEAKEDLATSKPSATDSTLPINVSSAIGGDSLEDTQQSDKPSHGCKRSCISQDLLFFGHVPKPCMFPPIIFIQPNHAQPILVIEAFLVVIISLENNPYPTDHVDWGGWRISYLFGTPLESNNTCVSIATLFQAASILLFQAAYFWLKFREALRSGRQRKLSGLQDVGCNEGGVHHSLGGSVNRRKRKSSATQVLQCRDKSDREGIYTRYVRDKSGKITHCKYEPRFKPPREKMDSGGTLKFDCLSLGQYNTPAEAKIVRQIAAFYYGKDEDSVELEDGSQFYIPPMSGQEQGLSAEEKRRWVTWKAKEVYAELRLEELTLKQLRRATMTGAHSGLSTDAGSDPSPSASTITYSSPASSAYELPLSQDHIPSSAFIHTLEPISASDGFLGICSGNCHAVQYNVPEMENDCLTSDDHGKAPRYTDDYIDDMIDELIAGPASIPPHQPSFQLDSQMHHFEITDSLGGPTPPHCDGTGQGFESIEHGLRPNLSFHQGWDLVNSSLSFRQRDPVLLQLVDHKKKQLEDAGVQNIDLQRRLGESETQILELQQEIKRLKAMLQQVALISNYNLFRDQF